MILRIFYKDGTVKEHTATRVYVDSNKTLIYSVPMTVFRSGTMDYEVPAHLWDSFVFNPYPER